MKKLKVHFSPEIAAIVAFVVVLALAGVITAAVDLTRSNATYKHIPNNIRGTYVLNQRVAATDSRISHLSKHTYFHFDGLYLNPNSQRTKAYISAVPPNMRRKFILAYLIYRKQSLLGPTYFHVSKASRNGNKVTLYGHCLRSRMRSVTYKRLKYIHHVTLRFSDHNHKMIPNPRSKDAISERKAAILYHQPYREQRSSMSLAKRMMKQDGSKVRKLS